MSGGRCADAHRVRHWNGVDHCTCQNMCARSRRQIFGVVRSDNSSATLALLGGCGFRRRKFEVERPGGAGECLPLCLAVLAPRIELEPLVDRAYGPVIAAA